MSNFYRKPVSGLKKTNQRKISDAHCNWYILHFTMRESNILNVITSDFCIAM